MNATVTSHRVLCENKKAVLSQGELRDAAVNFYMYRILQRHRAVFTATARLSHYRQI